MIDNFEERAQKALSYLIKTDESHAKAKAYQNRLGEVRKMVIAMGFESATGAAEVRRQAAHNTPEYHAHIEQQEQADVDFHTIDNQRKTAMAILDLYRTFSANTRKQ